MLSIAADLPDDAVLISARPSSSGTGQCQYTVRLVPLVLSGMHGFWCAVLAAAVGRAVRGSLRVL
jgi:hypothetical protein